LYISLLMKLSLATLWLMVGSLYTIILVIFTLNSGTTPKRNTEVQGIDNLTPEYNTPTPKAFKDTILAYQILTEFDKFRPTVFKDPEEQATLKKRYGTVNNGILAEDDYCNRVRANFVENPEKIMTDMSFVTDHAISSFLRKTIFPAIGLDPQPELHRGKSAKELATATIPFRTDLSIFYGDFVLYQHMDIGKHFSCLSQESNFIPGHSSLYRKDYVAKNFNQYVKKYEDKPQCFDGEGYYPRAYLMTNKDECVEFFKLFNSPRYQELKAQKNIVYIKKIGAGVHAGKGVFPVDSSEEADIRKQYKNGELCGQVQDNLIMQDFISNPLLIHGRKFDFRVFLLIASTNPVIAYYADGYLRTSLQIYDPNSTDKTVFIPNPQLVDNKILDKSSNSINGMSKQEILELQSWTFDQMIDYFVETGIVENHDWLEEKLRPEFQKAMIHLVRMSQSSFDGSLSSVYGFFGVDFMLDADLNLWFIEANSKPGFTAYLKKKQDLIFNVWKDQFEIVYNLMRSRMKRVMVFVNRLIENGEAKQLVNGDVQIANKEANTKEFARITRNYFEPEFQVSSNNMFVKIIDETETGPARYAGFIQPECF